MSMDMALLSCAPVPCPLTWHSARVAASAATPILCRKNAAAPRDHVNGHGPTKLRPGAMSMDMALLSCAPVAMSTDFVFVTWIHSRCEEAITRFEAQAVCHNSQSAALLSSSGLVMYFKYTPCALILSALHLDHSDAPLSARQNLHFDTPSSTSAGGRVHSPAASGPRRSIPLPPRRGCCASDRRIWRV